MTLKNLEYFCEICKDLNLSKTALRLYVTRQALSHAIQCLENELECALFTRTAAGLALTEQGIFFLSRCKALLHDLSETRSAITCANRRGTDVPLRISLFHGAYSMMLLPPFAPQGISVEYSYCDLTQCVQNVAEGQSDAAILPFRPTQSGLKAQLLYEIPVCAALSVTHPLTARDAVSICDLEEETLLFPEAYCAIHNEILTACRQQGVVFPRSLVTPTPFVAFHKCMQAQGVLLLDEHFLRNGISNNPYIKILPIREPLCVKLYFVMRASAASAKLNAFLQSLTLPR